MANQHRRGRTPKHAALAAPKVDETVHMLHAVGDAHILDGFTPFESWAEHLARCTPAVLDKLHGRDQFIAKLVRSNLALMRGAGQ